MSDVWGGNPPTNFDQANQALNGVPAVLMARRQEKQTQPQPVAQSDQSSSPTSTGNLLIDKLLTGMSSFNQTFQKANPGARIGSAIAGLLPGVKKAQQQQEQLAGTLAQQNPRAAGIGKLAGIVGSAVQPGGGATSIPQMAEQAGINMAPYAAIAGVNKYKETGK